MRTATRTTLLILALALGCSGSAALAAPNASRAVSLRALSAALRSGESVGQAQSLCGITRLCGYLVDGGSKDIVLLGVVDPQLPALHLDDFVVALRNVRGAYNRVSGRVQYYADPGCSIDPNPAVLAQLRDLGRSYDGNFTADSMKTHAELFKSIGRQPQKVRVMGVPFDTRFAKVMVDADYYMKRIVNGSVALGIDGLRSLSDMNVDEERQAMCEGRPAGLSGGSMNRFWFSPGESTYEVKDGAVLLRSCKVKLLTEEEFLTERGAISGMGRPNPCADQFARNFTAKYDQIAELRPIYKELRGLFVFVAVARLMREERADKQAGSALDYLLTSYKVGCSPVSRLVNGLTDVRQIDEMVNTPHGPNKLSMVQSSCGGVSMSVHPKRIVRRPSTVDRRPLTTNHRPSTTHPQLSTINRQPSIKTAVLRSRKSPKSMSWDVPVKLD